jgi:hypothetical protein
VQQQQARLRRDQHPHFIGDFLPATALEPFLRKENVNVSLQFLAIRRREAGIHGITAHKNVAPF